MSHVELIPVIAMNLCRAGGGSCWATQSLGGGAQGSAEVSNREYHLAYVYNLSYVKSMGWIR